MSKIDFLSNKKTKITKKQLLKLDYPELISEKYNCDFLIKINGKPFFDCSNFAIMEFLKSVIIWADRKDDLLFSSIETDDNPLISFIKEDDGLYSICSPWQLFECREQFSFEQLLSVVKSANIELD
ncbi:MAG: hypothetical protein IJL87_08000 [Clostridia bacterium]|nr:hypothetical protein [Clostridia bacterium]